MAEAPASPRVPPSSTLPSHSNRVGSVDTGGVPRPGASTAPLTARSVTPGPAAPGGSASRAPRAVRGDAERILSGNTRARVYRLQEIARGCRTGSGSSSPPWSCTWRCPTPISSTRKASGTSSRTRPAAVRFCRSRAARYGRAWIRRLLSAPPPRPHRRGLATDPEREWIPTLSARCHDGNRSSRRRVGPARPRTSACAGCGDPGARECHRDPGPAGCVRRHPAFPLPHATASRRTRGRLVAHPWRPVRCTPGHPWPKRHSCVSPALR